MARLFFALVPDDDLRQRIAAQAVALHQAQGGSGRLQAHERLHLTLRFLGDFEEVAFAPCREAALAAGDRIAAEPFDLVLDHAGSFGARTWWLGARGNPALSALRGRLDAALAAAGIAPAAEPFVPHVTIVRGAGKSLPATPIPPLPWRVRGFALLESRDGQGYQALRAWDA